MRTIHSRLSFLALLFIWLFSPTAWAQINLSNVPLFVTVNVTPNVVLTIDDSGSMKNAYTPDCRAPLILSGVPATADEVQGITDKCVLEAKTNKFNLKRYSAFSWNTQYYNPLIEYTIPVRKDGVTYSTSFNAANESGFKSTSNKVNLAVGYQLTNQCAPSATCGYLTCPTGETCSTLLNPQAAFYHIYYAGFNKPKPANCDGTVEDEDCYIKIEVGGPDDNLISKDLQSAEEKKKNFAIWFSFYRTRALAAITAATNAITSLDTDQIRLAWTSVNQRTTQNNNCFRFGTTCTNNTTGTSYENRMRLLDGAKSGDNSITHRTDFYNWVANMDFGSVTPLRNALARSGEYFKTSGVNSPYAEDPYITKGTELSCRKNFNIIFTDGLWNKETSSRTYYLVEGDETKYIDYGGNIDGTDTTLPDGKTYDASAPYKDNSSHSLADLAFKYWESDLRSDLTNNVPKNILEPNKNDANQQYWNPKNDPAAWQHMVTYTIGMGLTTQMKNPVWDGSTYAGDYDKLVEGTKSWPATNDRVTAGQEPAGHVYDLWHAAINSRAQFFSVDNPDEIEGAFDTIFNSIVSTESSAAAAALNTTGTTSSTMVFQARFDTTDWHGNLYAFAITQGDIGSAVWEVSEHIPAASARKIYTWNGRAGMNFNACDNLSTAQQLALNTHSSGTVDNLCAARLSWLRGDASNETRNKGSFRDRKTTMLGDIAHSAPAYVHTNDYGHASADFAEHSSYKSYVVSKGLKPPMIYVGANDGMLHAIRADNGHQDSGKEIFAFIPEGVYDKLSRLTNPAYEHTYFVDGAPQAGDAYWDGGWKTLLVGGLGAGGKSIYALNISDPLNFATGNILWEFSDSTDLGYTFGVPQIGRVNTEEGDWVVIFGNGYNSSSDKAYLYVVRARDGRLLKKIPAGDATGNGLSTPKLYDSNSDGMVDTVYAGDLLGNLWKFELSGTVSEWGVGNGGIPLFTASNAGGAAQPITVQPSIGKHTSGGLMVLFGTGRYLSSVDPDDHTLQSYYGIWDNGSSSKKLLRSNLQKQLIDKETSVSFIESDGTTTTYEVRIPSTNTVDWTTMRGWYLDLVPSNGVAQGERVVSGALVRDERVIFTSIIPSLDKCASGGESWLMELNYMSGGLPSSASFDLNGDKLIDGNDTAGGSLVGGRKLNNGIAGGIAVDAPGGGDGKGGSYFKIINGSKLDQGKEGLEVVQNPLKSPAVKRVFWQQIQ